MTSRICTTNNVLNDRKKIVSLREFLLANKKPSAAIIENWYLLALVESLFQNYWFCLTKCTLECKLELQYRNPGRVWTQDRTEIERTSVCCFVLWSVWHCSRKYWQYMTLQILAILLPVKMNEIEGTRPNSCSQAFAPAEIKRWSLQEWFSNILVQVKF